MMPRNFNKWFLFLIVFLGAASCASAAEAVFPVALDSYGDGQMTDLWSILKNRIDAQPFNLVATLLFLGAVVHTFMAGKFRAIGEAFEHRHQMKLKEQGYNGEYKSVSFRGEVMHFMGEVEAIFGIWVVPLLLSFVAFHGKAAAIHYIDEIVNYNEPMFVVVIMAIASTKPVLHFAETSLRKVAAIGKLTPAAWWLSIMTIAPILGSFITEPAAMTIAALLLGQRFYKLGPSEVFSYATIGLLFVNISVGGTLTHFAAPPVLMVAGTWDWDFVFMFTHFGWRAVLGIVTSNFIFWVVFRKQFKELESSSEHQKEICEIDPDDPSCKKLPDVPSWVVLVHLFFLAWTVFYLHHPALYIGGFLFFLAFTQATIQYQYKIKLREPLLVGFFLAGLVTHGGLQQWWIEPILSRMGETMLFFGSTILTAFNDNAAITYLASLVPSFQNNLDLQIAVVEGAVTGGGLTVIANAPNPAGQSILSKYFKGGVSPLGLFLGAAVPTAIMAFFFRVVGG